MAIQAIQVTTVITMQVGARAMARAGESPDPRASSSTRGRVGAKARMELRHWLPHIGWNMTTGAWMRRKAKEEKAKAVRERTRTMPTTMTATTPGTKTRAGAKGRERAFGPAASVTRTCGKIEATAATQWEGLGCGAASMRSAPIDAVTGTNAMPIAYGAGANHGRGHPGCAWNETASKSGPQSGNGICGKLLERGPERRTETGPPPHPQPGREHG
mmetsp:Transcript_104675/g.249219  ORF Transcript_104675/g.249219 Transcript_104675/m.249219 type:complete len:216 (-) Transcript_104675:366-1013(-)